MSFFLLLIAYDLLLIAYCLRPLKKSWTPNDRPPVPRKNFIYKKMQKCAQFSKPPTPGAVPPDSSYVFLFHIPKYIWYYFSISDETKQDDSTFVEAQVEIPQVDGISGEQLAKMGKYLMQGLPEPEAALLAGIDKTTTSVLKRNSGKYNEFVERKRLEFKRKHLAVLAGKNDPKISQWLLERTDEQFAGKKKSDDVPDNIVGAIIKDIQHGNGEGSELSFAYNEQVKNDGSEAQRASRRKAADNIRQVLQ